jgi:hypothetical protein
MSIKNLNYSKNKMNTRNSAYTYTNKTNDSYILEAKGEILLYSEIIKGASRFSNYFWAVMLFLFGLGFMLTGFSSYFFYSKQNIPFLNFTEIEFLPQGILLLFYGSCATLLSILILFFIKLDLGSGTNTFDIEAEVIRISRKGFPKISNKLKMKQSNIYLVYPFSEITNIDLEITNGINPERTLYLNLKDNRRIPVTLSNQINDLGFLEKRAIFIAKLLKTELKLKNNLT